LGIGKRKKTERTKGRKGYGKTEFGQDAAISVEEEAIWMRAHLEIIVCKFGRNRAVCVVVEAIYAKSLQTDGRTDK